MSTTSPECYGCDPRARAILVEVSANQVLVLPHEQLVYSELTTGGEADSLHMVFTTHEVRLHGHLLKRLLEPIQDRQLAWIGARTEWDTGKTEQGVTILKLEVRAVANEPSGVGQA